MRVRDSRPDAAVARVTAATRVLAAHEDASLDAMAAQIAALRGARYMGCFGPADVAAGIHAYFVPDDTALKQLVEARQRGVEIEVIVPNHLTDVPIVRQGSRHFWGELLRAGVRIYEFQPTMYHPKILIVDGEWTSFGSANFDERSLRLNDEASLNVFGPDFTSTQIDIFEADLERSREISLAEWEARSLSEKITDWLASTLRSQL